VNPSSPVYSGLQPDPQAKAHLIVAEGDGAAAVIDLYAAADAGFAGCATLLYAAGSAAQHAQLLALGAKLLPDIAALLRASKECMEQAGMGTTIYLTGSPSFIGEAAKLAGGYGVSFASLRTEARGSAGKRVQCVHCKSIEANVVTATVTCSHCRLKLLVRDHYSHRLNAFMGVCCEAERAG
jgi:hypothetical protein